MLVLSHRDVVAVLEMGECIEAMGVALTEASTGPVHNPLRFGIRPDFESPGVLGLMPAVRGGDQVTFGLKEVCVFAGNHALGLDSHQGSVLLHDSRTGELQAVLNGTAVTGIRTAAVSAVATRALARPEGLVHAIIGAGHQARWHIRAMAAAGLVSEVRVAARSLESAQSVATDMADQCVVSAFATAEEAIAGADVVTTVTTARDPITEHKWFAAGVHLNAVGSSVSVAREIDTATVAASSVFVDRRESCLNESGDFLMAAEAAGFGAEHIRGEVGEVLAGKAPGRTSDDEQTLFVSLGLGIEDLIAAQLAVSVARERGIGTEVDFN